MKQHLLHAIQLGLLTIALAACASSPTTATPGAVMPTAVSATPIATLAPAATATPILRTADIIKDYEANQAAANAQYQGKTLRMTGKVTNINDVFDVKALMLRDSENETGLQCYLADSADAQQVSIGQTITIEGVIKGGELGPFMVAEPCHVVQS